MKDLILPTIKAEWLADTLAHLPTAFTPKDFESALRHAVHADKQACEESGLQFPLAWLMRVLGHNTYRSAQAFFALYGLRLTENGNGTYGYRSDESVLSGRKGLLDQLINLIGTTPHHADITSPHVTQWLGACEERIRFYTAQAKPDNFECVQRALEAYGYRLEARYGVTRASDSRYDIMPTITIEEEHTHE